MMEDWDEEYSSDERLQRPGYRRSARSAVHRSSGVERDPYGRGLHRHRSSGHAPAPNINNFWPPPPRGRDLRPDHDAPAGRSRSRSAIAADDLERYEREWRRRARDEEDEARRREEDAVKHFREQEDEREKEREQVIRDAKIDADRKEADRKEAVRQAIRDDEEKKRKATEERKDLLERARLEEEEEKRKEKAKREEILSRMKIEEEEKKAKEKAAWEEYERKKLAEKEKEKEKKAKEDKEYMDRVARDFGRFGFTETQIKRAISREDEKKETSAGALVAGGTGGRRHSRNFSNGNRPVYPKIHRQDIAIETLKYYDLDYEYDRSNKDFIVIMHELTEDQTDELFEHTRSLKTHSKGLLESGRGRKDNEYMWVKKRERGVSRGKSRDRSHGGLRERFAGNLVRRM